MEERKQKILSIVRRKIRVGGSSLCMCKEDEVMKEDFQRVMIENYHPKQDMSISAAGHMFMLSKSKELCQILLEHIAYN